MRMYRSFPLVVVAVLTSAILIVGCSTIPQAPSPVPPQQDPIVGVWTSHQSDSTTFYRFWGNGTFNAWSNTGDIHPKYSFRYSGQWKQCGPDRYITEGPHIGFGEVTPLAIWSILTLVYDSRQDTFSITAWPDEVFTRVSYDPDFPVS